MGHNDLLSILIKFISNAWNESVKIMYIDHDFLDKSTQPPKIEKHIPDVYARIDNDRCVVGEAKTINDFQSVRSQRQLKCFLRYSSNNNCIFCISIPFTHHRSVSSRLEHLINSNNYVIDGYVVHEFGFRRLRCNL